MTNPTPHGQVPEALETPSPDQLRAIARVARNSSGGASDDCGPLAYVLHGWRAAVTALRTQQPAGWKAVPVNPTPEMWKAAKTVPDPNPPYPPHYGLVWDAMLAASPTPPAPAEQQASATEVALVGAYARLPDFDSGDEPIWEAVFKWKAANPGSDASKKAMAVEGAIIKSLRDFADRTHALRMQAAPKAAAGEPEKLMRDCLALLESFDYEDDEDSQSKAFFKAHINADWFFHVKRSIERQLEAKAAPQQEAQEPATVPYQKLTNEIDLILTDPNTVLSFGARRALHWMRTWVSVPLYTEPQPAPAPLSDDVVQDAAFDAVRKKLCALPRFSFLSDGYGVRRVPDKSGSWIAFDAAHALFDPVAVDAAIAAQGGKT